MSLLQLEDIDVVNQRVFLRVDFNVPLDANGAISDDTRIRAALPTIHYLLDQGATLVIASHLGRPKGKVQSKLSLMPVAEHLAGLLNQDVLFADDCVGDAITKMVHEMRDQRIILLENLRFHAEEKQNDAIFSQQLADLADVYVNDAFGVCHRAHASIAGIAQHFPGRRAAGRLIHKEIDQLNILLHEPRQPFICILGGAKVSDKIKLIGNLLPRVDSLIIGGAMANTFLAAQGVPMGDSLVESDRLKAAQRLLDQAQAMGRPIYLPQDHMLHPSPLSAAMDNAQKSHSASVEDGFMALDIGLSTQAHFDHIIRTAKTIFWNGPMGMFEHAAFAKGTLAVAQSIVASKAHCVVGGGDSLSAIKKLGLEGKFAHLSTGGGASLEFLEGKPLPGFSKLRA